MLFIKKTTAVVFVALLAALSIGAASLFLLPSRTNGPPVAALPTASETPSPQPTPTTTLTPSPSPSPTPDPMLYYTPEYREEGGRIDDLVDIRRIDDTIRYDMIFATERNITGGALYGAPACLVQRELGEMLKAAQERFARDGYSLKLYDAYRPRSVQYALFEWAGGNTRYVANPANASMHNRGCAVDATLTDASGVELEMPSSMHDLGEAAHRDRRGISEAARQNMDYMTAVMVEAGFGSYRYEWWHFTLPGGADKYLATDHDLGQMPLLP